MKWNKEENSTPSGSGASKKKKYHYADILSFLKPVAEKRSTTGNFEDNLDESVQVEQTFEEISPTSETEQNAIASTSTSQVHTKKFKKTVKETPITPFQNKLLTYLEERECNDPDKHFLLSLLPDYKNLNDSQKLDFRINALNFFKNANQTHNISSSSSTYQPANVYQNNNSYQDSSSFYLPPHRQPEINNPYYPNVVPPYPQPVVYSPTPQPQFSQYQQKITSNASNATFSLTNISSNFAPNTSSNK
ncbi:uncharacterized protein LOC111032273 [Myzus persicae]|uniref:uncharacterized protein LOC111032273 n=1 Tax=Myzus persicae TaxID=13164 RepID=UPI000B93027C|nr:uncharacterized protein LOC111032273 [Myzus persicae]